MQVSFYNFNKRINSTARPTGSGTVIDCIIKDGSSQLAPTIRIKWSSGAAPVYNYAYISAFGGRYYFVADWTFEDRQWTARLSVDVLATYKTNIGSLSKYVLRSASAENKNVMDTLYPAKATYTQASQTITNGLARFGAGGVFVLACVNDQSIAYTDTQPPLLFQMSARGVQEVMSSVINSFEGAANDLNTAAGLEFKDAITMILKAPGRIFSDLNQFVKSVTWFPCEFTATYSPVYVGKYSVSAYSGKIITDPIYSNSMIDVNLGGFPPADTAKWKYMEPYASYYLNCPPFGIIPLASEDVINGNTLRLSLSIDALSGLGRLIVKIRKGNDPVTTRDVADRTAQVGVTYPFGGSTPDYASGIAGAGAMGVAAAMMESGGVAAGAMMAGAIGTAAKGLGYQGFTGGSFSGGALGNEPTWSLNWRYYDIVDQDPVEQGYALCETRTINTLSGYVKVVDGDITSLTATDSELMQVKSYLEGGFYYE